MRFYRLLLVAAAGALFPGCRGAPRGPVAEVAADADGSASPWVRWPQLPLLDAARDLGVTRQRLLQNNMIDTNDADRLDRDPLTGAVIDCPAAARRARTLDGSCNVLERPAVGMRGMTFGRNMRERETFAERSTSGKDLVSPPPTAVADKLMTREEFMPAKTINLLVPAWIQFMTHDWFSHGVDAPPSRAGLPERLVDLGDGRRKMVRTPRLPALPKNTEDGVRDRNSVAASEPKRNAATGGGLDFVTRNQATHWWDASQIYGTDPASQRRVRAYKDGLMRMGRDGNEELLPLDPETRQEVAGVRDGWWIGVSLLHHLFAKEHNHVAGELKRRNPDWDDQRLFDTTRLIIAAIIAKIHTIEWTPAVISHPIAVISLQANWNGKIDPEAIERSLDDFRRASPRHARAAEVLVRGARGLGGLVGNPASQSGVDYTLTEEFTSVYRMHPLLPESIPLRGAAALPMQDVLGPRSPGVLARHGVGNLFAALGGGYAGALTLHNFPTFLRPLHFDAGELGSIDLDMAALDIARDRERGVPRYNRFREELGLGRLRGFEDFIDADLRGRVAGGRGTEADTAALRRQERTAEELRALYEDDIDSVDLLAGSLAENTRPAGFGFGETSFQIFILNASRRLLTDRFFTDAYTAEYYTQFGLDYIREQSMTTLLRRHYGAAVAALLPAGKNAFTPWQDDVPVPTLTFANPVE